MEVSDLHPAEICYSIRTFFFSRLPFHSRNINIDKLSLSSLSAKQAIGKPKILGFDERLGKIIKRFPDTYKTQCNTIST